MKTVFAYTRVSTVRQGTQGSSLQEQKASIERYASANQLRVVLWFEEQETAAKRGRPVFGKMLRLLIQKRASGVVLHKIDRGARNLKDWADLAELTERGIEIHFAHESVDLSSRGGRLAADIQAVVAADYVRNLREEVKKGIYGRYRQGLYPHMAPRGYLDQGGGKVKIVDPNVAPFIRTAFELYATENYSLDGLRHEMARRGFCRADGKAFGKASTANLLSNEFYIGTINTRIANERFVGLHEPIIPVALFNTVQKVLRGRKVHAGLKHDFLFRRTLRCQSCSYHLAGERQKGIIYYRCHTQSCATNTIREDHLWDQVLERLRAVSLPEALLHHVHQQFMKFASVSAPGRMAKRKQQELAYGKLDEQMGRLTDAYLEGFLDGAEYKKRKAVIVSRMAAVRQELNESESALPELTTVKIFLELLSSLNKAAKQPHHGDILRMLKLTTSNREIWSKSLLVDWEKGFDLVAEWKTVQCGGRPLIELRSGQKMTAEQKIEIREWMLKLYKSVTAS